MDSVRERLVVEIRAGDVIWCPRVLNDEDQSHEYRFDAGVKLGGESSTILDGGLLEPSASNISIIVRLLPDALPLIALPGHR